MITIDSTPFNQIKAHGDAAFPDECCGFLFGNEESGDNRRVLQIHEVNNAKAGDKRRRFEITAKDYMRAEQFALTNHISLLGIYHSHPGHPAIPSEHDRIAAQPFFSYVIISVINGNTDHVRSWRLNDASQLEEEIFSPVLKKQTI